MEALVLSLVIHFFLAALTVLHWRTLNPTEEALMSLLPAHAHTYAQHTHTQLFPKIADGLFSWTYIISRWRSWIKPDGNKSGETGNLKKQKWRGMELGKKNNLPPPPLLPWTFRKDQLVNYTVKNRGTVYHTWTCGRQYYMIISPRRKYENIPKQEMAFITKQTNKSVDQLNPQSSTHISS